MADQKQIKLWQGAVDPKQIVLRPLPVADSQSTTIYLYAGNASATNITLRDPRSVQSAGGATTYTYQPTGGVTFAGAGSITRTFASSVSGGVAFAGAALLSRTFAYPVSGGVAFSGAAAVSRAFTPGISGGLSFAGTAAIARTISAVVSGGVTFSGAAPVARTAVYSPSGGVSFSGTAGVTRTAVYWPSDGVSFSGAAGTEYVSASVPLPQPRPYGGVGFVEPPLVSQSFTYRGAGRIGFGGRARVTRTRTVVGSAFVAWTGAAQTEAVNVSVYQYMAFAQVGFLARAESSYERSLIAIQEEEILALWL